jgi:hypothetical protein
VKCNVLTIWQNGYYRNKNASEECRNRRFGGTSVHTRSTRRHIPVDGILHIHRRENIKSYKNAFIFRSRQWIELARVWTNSWVPWEAQYSTSHEITSWTDWLLYGLMNDDGQMGRGRQMEQPKSHRTADDAASPYTHKGWMRDFIPPFPPSSTPILCPLPLPVAIAAADARLLNAAEN